MGVLTSQKIAVFYERFKGIDVTFTKEIILVTGLMTNQVYLKCVGDFWPCVIYSTSFQGAKVVANIKSGILQKLETANNMVSLRFCFRNPDTGNPVTFFVTSKSLGYTPYGESKDMALFSLQFTQRPPDDLIEIVGRILDANVNSAKRREDRLDITPDLLRKMNLLSKESAIFIQGVPRRCILRDISFSGTKIIMMGVAKFLVNKDVSLRMDFDDPRESFLLKGKFIRSEIVEGRKELVALAILFDESLVPMGYKIRINDYLSSLVRTDGRGGEKGAGDSLSASAKGATKPAAKGAPVFQEAAAIVQETPGAGAAKTEAPPASGTPSPVAAKSSLSNEGDFDLALPSG